MTTREKKLGILFLGILGTVVTVGGGLRLITSGFGAGSMAVNQSKLREIRAIVESRDEWEDRDRWVVENIPSYPSETTASAKVLERVARLTKAHGVRIERQEILNPDPDEDAEKGNVFFYDRIEMTIELSGAPRKIVECIHEMQTPKFFMGIDGLTLEASPKEGMLCRLLVTQWYRKSSDG